MKLPNLIIPSIYVRLGPIFVIDRTATALDTPRQAGGLMSGAASKAIEYCSSYRTSPTGAQRE
jgi:hypothetical protein